MIGDADPEDAWDDTDSVDVRLRLLERIVASIEDHADTRQRARAVDGLRLVAKLRGHGHDAALDVFVARLEGI
jgi:hypothetical protein